jgi:uncharacterized protein YecE (DUF72 family)
MMKPVRVGCSGWQYKDWREVLYPKGLAQRRWLERYSEVFDTVEVNSTFYRLASPKAVAGWVEQTPDDFVFSVKASRYLTHYRRLTGLEEGVKRFYEAIAPLVESGKLGPVLWQLPGKFHRDDERLEGALESLPKGRHCFEFRHPSWFEDRTYELLRRYGAALVIADGPDQPFQTQEMTADWTFVRFHRGRKGRGGNYSQREVDDWARRIRSWRKRTEVFAYFNNDWRGYAVRNARRLASRLEAG